jgi:MATE family multidrug resistance protein
MADPNKPSYHMIKKKVNEDDDETATHFASDIKNHDKEDKESLM